MFGESQGWPFPKGPNSLVTTATVNAILDDIEADPNAGRHYSAAPNAGARAAWPVVARHCPALTEAQVRLAVATWVRKGMIEIRQTVSRGLGCSWRGGRGEKRAPLPSRQWRSLAHSACAFIERAPKG